MQPKATQAERDRAKAGHLIEKFRSIGPAAVLAALVCSGRKAANTGHGAPAKPQTREGDAG
jgi:hypothetical protein